MKNAGHIYPTNIYLVPVMDMAYEHTVRYSRTEYMRVRHIEKISNAC